MGGAAGSGHSGGWAELDLMIEGMHCSACASRIERALGKMDGVREAAVSFPLRTAWVQMEPEKVTPDLIRRKVGQLGFSAAFRGPAGEGLESERRRLAFRLAASVLMTLPLLAGMARHMPGLAPVFDWLPDWLQLPWLQLALATAIQFVIGMPFYFGAYYALRQRSANMDVLVAVGTSAAYLYSHYVVFREGAFFGSGEALHGAPVYFETSAVVMTAVLLGKYIEATMSLRARQDSDGFGKLQAATAKVAKEGGVEEVRTEYVREGDVVIVGPGELIPVDGIVSEGESAADEALLTGESRPVPKRAGDKAWAGTRNDYGTLTLVTTAAGHSAMLSRIRQLVKQGERSKSALQRQADAAAAWFVPAMLILAAATFVAWAAIVQPGDWRHAATCAIAVLLAACPCALGLAAPISLLIASGRLARRGIIAKEAEAVEKLASVDTFVFDKTGTLTEGSPRVAAVKPFGIGAASLLRLAAALEYGSAHPLAAAVRKEAQRQGITPPSAANPAYFPGKGAIGDVQGRFSAIGNARFMEELGVELDKEVRLAAAWRERMGETVLYVALDRNGVGMISFTDAIKPSASAMLSSLGRLGVTPVIATGDHPAPASAVARALGIREVHASMLPEDKLQLIERLKGKGKRVAMAGDGWNDAPALAAADAGIAMGSGADAALDAGHITLLYPGLSGIAETIRISRLTIRNIRQNLAFALLYNAAIIPFAMLGWLQPWMAGTAMALSSVSVAGNALRLRASLRSAAGGDSR